LHNTLIFLDHKFFGNLSSSTLLNTFFARCSNAFDLFLSKLIVQRIEKCWIHNIAHLSAITLTLLLFIGLKDIVIRNMQMFEYCIGNCVILRFIFIHFVGGKNPSRHLILSKEGGTESGEHGTNEFLEPRYSFEKGS
jgi:hypothetical protein